MFNFICDNFIKIILLVSWGRLIFRGIYTKIDIEYHRVRSQNESNKVW